MVIEVFSRPNFHERNVPNIEVNFRPCLSYTTNTNARYLYLVIKRNLIIRSYVENERHHSGHEQCMAG